MATDEIDRLRAAFNNSSEDEAELIASIEYDLAQEIDEKNSWSEFGEMSDRQRMLIFKMASTLLRRVAEFVTKSTPVDTDKAAIRLAKRNIAWIWVLFPQLVLNAKDKPATLQQLGDLFGNTRCWMSMLAEEFSREFDYLSRNQKPLSSRHVYAEGARRGWAKRRAKSESKCPSEDTSKRK